MPNFFSLSLSVCDCVSDAVFGSVILVVYGSIDTGPNTESESGIGERIVRDVNKTEYAPKLHDSE